MTTMTLTSSRPPSGLRATDTLSHWTTARARYRLDASVAPTTELRLRSALTLAEMAEDEMIEYSAIFATEDPWLLRLWSYDAEERRYAARWTRLRLKLSKQTVFVDLKTPAGVPLKWNHFGWGSPTVGRVVEIGVSNSELRGSAMISSAGLAAYSTSHGQLDAGMNSGISLGGIYIDQPTFKRAKGDTAGAYDNPDDVFYARIRVDEGSLTAAPQIKQAGLTGRKETTT